MANQQILSILCGFICPITPEIMQNPVLRFEDVSTLLNKQRTSCYCNNLIQCHSYELYGIECWSNDYKSSLITKKTLNDRRLVHIFNLRNAIEDYYAQKMSILSTNQFLTFIICQSHVPVE